MSPIVSWLLATMLAWQPASRTARGPWPELRTETTEQTEARYAELAKAAFTVAQSHPPVFSGPEDRGRARTALMLLSLAFYESGFHNRVTTLRGDDKDRSDQGRAWCAVQILLGRDGVGNRGKGGHLLRLIPEGWTGPELEADPIKCLTVGYRFAVSSFETCKRPSLGAYTGEGCNGPKGRARLRRARSVPLPALLFGPQAPAPAPSGPVAALWARLAAAAP